MKQIRHTGILLLFVFFILLAVQSCLAKKLQASLTPPDKRPVSSVVVEDAIEASLLQQQLKMDIVKLEGNRLYYYAENTALMEKLKGLGYTQINSEEAQQVYKKYVSLRLPKRTDTTYKDLAAALRRQQVQVINRERDHWVIYGTLDALNNLKKSGYVLQNLTYELRPREVEVYVTAVEDVQKVAQLGIDVFSTERVKADSTILIHGAAYDYQIDSVKVLRYQVSVKKQRL